LERWEDGKLELAAPAARDWNNGISMGIKKSPLSKKRANFKK
jgi:hypothetical protein